MVLIKLQRLAFFPRMGFTKSVRAVVPADWGILDGQQNCQQATELLTKFNEYYNQRWQFNPTTGIVEIVPKIGEQYEMYDS